MNGWRITWRGLSWWSGDVLASDLATVQTLTGGGWADCDPWRGPVQLMAMIAALSARSSGRLVDDVLAEIRQAPAAELVGAIAPPDEESGVREPRRPVPSSPSIQAVA